MKGIRDLRDRELHVGGLLPVDNDDLLGRADLAAQSGVGDAIDFFHKRHDLFGEGIGYFQVISSDLDLNPVSAALPHPQKEESPSCSESCREARNV